MLSASRSCAPCNCFDSTYAVKVSFVFSKCSANFPPMGSTRSGGTPTDTRRSAARASAGDTVTALPETALVLSRLLRRLRAVLLPSAGRAVRHPENQVFEKVLPRFGDDGRIGDCTRAHGVLDRQALESRYRCTVRSRRELGLLVSGVDAAHPLTQRERAPGLRRALNL